MKVFGLQKLTLLDYPGNVAATVFTAGCNMRCPFCHNAGLVENINPNEEIGENAVFDLLKKRKGILDGICITGGEPLLHDDLASFIKQVKALGYKVKLDTNGSFPNKLELLLNEGLLDYVAVDIKNRKEKYSLTTGLKNFDTKLIDETINILKNGNVDYEFRTTVLKNFHTVEDIRAIAQWIEGAKAYYLQNFVDTGKLLSKENMEPWDKDTLNNMLEIAKNYISNCELRGI
ncbi:MAG: anaerobic ribonucleoside-triphosphate reductase activating protein [Christensenellaceae bacterium]|nr:anaerobic ribonucleoside-triphosphate reductase activating protein [Christensenellaceae bacterium]